MVPIILTLKAEWRYASTTPMVQSVMTTGIFWMQWWSAINLGTHLMVCYKSVCINMYHPTINCHIDSVTPIPLVNSIVDAVPFRNAFYGNGSGTIFLDNVICQGTESSLLDCTTNPIGEHNCDHSEDAGVRCEGIVDRMYLCMHYPSFLLGECRPLWGECEQGSSVLEYKYM